MWFSRFQDKNSIADYLGIKTKTTKMAKRLESEKCKFHKSYSNETLTNG